MARRKDDRPPARRRSRLAFGNAVNDRDQVVGNENTASNHEVIAALWSGGHGYDLNTLVAPNPLQMISADYITN